MGTIAQEITRLQTAKSDLKTSIEAKGVTVPSNALIDTYSGYVDQISTGGATLGTKTINANGTYNASSDSLDGYSQVTVDVQPVQTNVTIKALFPDNNVPGRAWRSSLMKLEYSTDGETWTSVSRSGVDNKYNTYTVPNGCLVRPDVSEPQNQYGQQNYYNDNGGSTYTSGTYSAIYSLHTDYSYTIYGESAVSTALEQMAKVTTDGQIVIFCYSQTNT